MSPARQADPELDALIDEVTVDCHDEYEQLTTATERSGAWVAPGRLHAQAQA